MASNLQEPSWGPNAHMILLQGNEHSGKIDFLRRMELSVGGGIADMERTSCKQAIFRKMILPLQKRLLALAREERQLEPQGLVTVAEINDHVQTILAVRPAQLEEDVLPLDVVSALEVLWEKSDLQGCLRVRYPLFCTLDTCDATYFLDSLLRISQPNYLPSDLDIIRSRPNTMIREFEYIRGGSTYRITDAYIDNSKRKLWHILLDSVTAIMFLVNIASYDLLRAESLGSSTPLQDDLTSFHSFVNSLRLTKSAMLLVFTNMSEFKAKLPHSPLERIYPDYMGGSDYSEACDFILNLFCSQNKVQDKQIYVSYSSSSDVEPANFVEAAVQDFLAYRSLRPKKSFSSYEDEEEDDDDASRLVARQICWLC